MGSTLSNALPDGSPIPTFRTHAFASDEPEYSGSWSGDCGPDCLGHCGCLGCQTQREDDNFVYEQARLTWLVRELDAFRASLSLAQRQWLMESEDFIDLLGALDSEYLSRSDPDRGDEMSDAEASARADAIAAEAVSWHPGSLDDDDAADIPF